VNRDTTLSVAGIASTALCLVGLLTAGTGLPARVEGLRLWHRGRPGLDQGQDALATRGRDARDTGTLMIVRAVRRQP